MTQVAQDEELRAALRGIDGFDTPDLEIGTAFPVLASPSWRGVDGAPLIVRNRAAGRSLFVKRLHPDTAFYIDPDAACAAATAAGAAGIGPRVLLARPSQGLLVMEDLSPGWQVCGLERVARAGFADRLLQRRADCARLPGITRAVDVFTELPLFHAMLCDTGAPVPSDMGWVFDTVMRAAPEARGACAARVVIHGDGNLSNVMTAADGRIRLVDFDRCGVGSPLEEIGSALVEMCELDPAARQVFARCLPMWEGLGIDPERGFAAARLYGVADDLRWAMIAMVLDHVSPRRTQNEFYKFGIWRFLRARIAIRDPRFGERLGVAA
ncbi:phosphotransferase family protein [Frigidibacter sp. MR17.24]|uniref:phosphotransferase family protein n=1 Tax=Frigidibacter sp. MR17.24 TaxID=3127345 RepID=UPI003012C7CD